MKKFFNVFCLLFLLIIPFAISACSGNDENSNNSNNTTSELLQFSNVTMEDKEYIYNGEVYFLVISGAYPEGTNIEYENNNKKDAGEYEVVATLTKQGYETKTLKANLVIKKAEFNGIIFKDKSVVYSGNSYSIVVEGDIPNETEIVYTNNNKKDAGEYEVSATLTNPNYNTITIQARLIITRRDNLALSIINALLVKQDLWRFLPSALTPQKMAYAQMPVGGMEDFSTSVATSRIEKKVIGKQFNVLYEGISDATSIMSKIDEVIDISTTIANIYQTFINRNPDNYATFEGEAGGFKTKIQLAETTNTLLIGNANFSAEMKYESLTKTREFRMQLANNFKMKFVSTATTLKLAVQTKVGDVASLKQIEFTRDGNVVMGYLREFLGTEEKNLKTTAIISSNADTTIIMSNKRETDDLEINGYEEVYSSATGELLGARVQEKIATINYDTLWFHLKDVQGIQSVKVADDNYGLNADSIYVNGEATIFQPKKVSPLPASSRRFDVEMKEVWYVVKEEVDSKIKYNLVKTLIPMLFVQKEYVDTFDKDVRAENSYIINASLPSSNIAQVNLYFDRLKEMFNQVKNSVTYAEIVSFIGNRNEYFEQA